MSATKFFVLVVIGLATLIYVRELQKPQPVENEPQIPSSELVDLETEVVESQKDSNSSELSTAAFRRKAVRILEDIKNKDEVLKEATKNPHSTPLSLLRRGRHIGELAQAIRENETLASEGLHFYQQCSLETEAPLETRAVCFARYTELVHKLEQIPDERFVASIPVNIRKLATEITN